MSPILKFSPIFLITALIASCSRPPDTSKEPAPVPDSAFQYKVNGNLVTIKDISVADGEYAMFTKFLRGTFPSPRLGAIPNTTYFFNGVKNSNQVYFVMGIVSDSLAIGNYTYDSTYSAGSKVITNMSYNGSGSGLFCADDYININITSCSHSYVSGNFTARFTPFDLSLAPYTFAPDYNARSTVLITEGEFRNIKCIY